MAPQRIADDFTIAPDRLTITDVGERDLMALRHVIDQAQPVGEDGTGGQAKIIDNNRDIVRGMQLDITRRVLVV